MENPRPDEGGRRRGRRAAPPTGPVGPLETAAAAVAAGLTVGRAKLVAARGRADEAVTAFRSGPVLPWISAHRMFVLIGGALLVSALAIGGAVAMIAQVPGPTAGGGIAEDDPTRPQPGSSSGSGSRFTMPSPQPTTPSPTPSPTPRQTADPPTGDAGTPVVAPDTDEPTVPTTDPVTDSNGRPDPPGATNRPDKPKD